MGAALAPIISGVGAIASNAMQFFEGQVQRGNEYQKAVADMRKAGLNPALAYQQGGAGPVQTQMPNLGDAVASGMQTSSAMALQKSQRDLLDAQADYYRRSTPQRVENLGLQGDVLAKQAPNIQADTVLKGAQSATEQQRRAQLNAITMNLLNDNRFKTDSYQNRLNLLAAAVKQAGLDITQTELRTLLMSMQVPQAKAIKSYWEGPGRYSPYLSNALDVARGVSNFMPWGRIAGAVSDAAGAANAGKKLDYYMQGTGY